MKEQAQSKINVCVSQSLSQQVSPQLDFNTFFIEANQQVRQSGKHNFQGCKILLPSSFNFPFLEQHLTDYQDTKLVDMLKFGFPIGRINNKGSKQVPNNHLGARAFPAQMEKIVKKEIESGAAIGPFENSPFGNNTFYSPLNSVPKKGTDERRLILDLSYPIGNSINDSIDKDWYLGSCEKLTLPSIDALTDRIMQLGKMQKFSKLI